MLLRRRIGAPAENSSLKIQHRRISSSKNSELHCGATVKWAISEFMAHLRVSCFAETVKILTHAFCEANFPSTSLQKQMEGEILVRFDFFEMPCKLWHRYRKERLHGRARASVRTRKHATFPNNI